MTTAIDGGGPVGFRFENPVEELLARREIEALVIRRARAADAKDADAIVALHVPGSTDLHGIFDGTIEQFGEYLKTHNYSDPRYGVQMHTVSNLLVTFVNEREAHCESHVIAYHRLYLPDGARDVFIGGRCLDRCQRDDRWRLASRVIVNDWSRSGPVGNTVPSHDPEEI